MPLPTARAVHIDAGLTNISVAYFQSVQDYIYPQVFPVVPVDHQSDKYFVFDRADLLRSVSAVRAPATRARRRGFRLSQDSYFAENHAVDQPIPDPVRNNADPGVDLERAATLGVTQDLMIGAEANFVTEFWSSGAWATSGTAGTDFTAWDDFGGGDPLADISTRGVQQQAQTGFKPNTLVVDAYTDKLLKRHPLILERTKYTSAESITNAIIARYFEVDRYLVAGATRTTSAEGASSDTFDFILGRGAWLGYVNPTPGLMVPSAGYTFVWRGMSPLGNAQGVAIKRYRDEPIASDIVEGNFAYDFKVVARELGHFFVNPTST